MLQVYVSNISVISNVCCKCFYLDVAMAAHVCFKCIFQMFQLFQIYVASVLSRYWTCCTSYTSILQLYVLNVSAVLNVCCKYFIWMLHLLQWSYTYCKCMFTIVLFVSNLCFSKCFKLHDQTREVGADGGDPLGRSSPHVRAESEADTVASTCLRRCMHIVAADEA
jgi:hypothetical protein